MKKILLFIAAVMVAMTVSAVTFNVTVPAGTQVCYVAGAPSWSHVQMEKVSDTQFTLTTDALDGTAYKYCAGDGWAYVEKDESGEEILDRTYSENDVVAAWAAVQDPSVVVTYTWAVCGVGELVGDAWDPASEANEMTESNGVFTLVKYGVELTPDFMTDADNPERATQGYGYKVAANDDWGIKEFPTGGANQFLVVDVAGIYDVTFTWDPTNVYLEATATLIKNLMSLELDDDAAYVNWGTSWRMPTKEEQDELRNTSYTTWTWTTLNGINGYKVTSKINGNSIFLPAAGYRFGSSLHYTDILGYYWGSSLYAYDSDKACGLNFKFDSVDSYNDYRDHGKSIRPVLR